MNEVIDKRIRLGISACLLGENVRFDGGHKHDRFLTDTLGQYVEYVPVCPEVECGFGIPREPFRLLGDPESPELVTSRTGVDFTERMQQWSFLRAKELEEENLCGFIFKSGSPSSGMERVKVYDLNGVPAKTGVGIFAKKFMEHFPLLPVEDDGRLHDPVLRENFIERVFVFQRWKALLSGEKTLSALVEFHTRHKYLILSHDTEIYRELGRMVADGKQRPREELLADYEKTLMKGLLKKPTPKTHTNVLMHIMGYFKKQLVSDEKQELLEIIDEYRNHLIPLIVPITLLNHYVRKYDQPYLKQQYYLHPHPIELQLRNHV